jgi:hypothetical protein
MARATTSVPGKHRTAALFALVFLVIPAGAIVLQGHVSADDSARSPLPDAAVSLERMVDLAPAKRAADVPQYELVAIDTTDSAGHYLFETTEAAVCRVSFLLDGYEQYQVHIELNADRVLDITMRNSDAVETLFGTVTCVFGPGPLDTLPVQGVSVSILLSEPGAHYVTEFSAETDASGHYEITGLPTRWLSPQGSSTVAVRAYKPDFLPDSVEITLCAGCSTRVDLRIKHASLNTAIAIYGGFEYGMSALDSIFNRRESNSIASDPVELHYWVTNQTDSLLYVPFDELCRDFFTGDRAQARIELSTPQGILLPATEFYYCEPMELSYYLLRGDTLNEFRAFTLLDPPDTVLVSSWLNGYRATSEVSLTLRFGDAQPVRPRQTGSAARKALCAVRNGMLWVTLPHSQVVSVTAFALDGRVVARPLCRILLTRGEHAVPIAPHARAAGGAVLRVELESEKRDAVLWLRD